MFLDFVLLTRVARIFAEASVFAILPGLIGKGEVTSLEQALEPRTVIAAVWDFVRESAGKSDLEVGLACSFLDDRLQGQHSSGERDELLEIAVAADGTNPTFVLAAAARLLERGDRSSAEALLARAAAKGLPDYCLRLVEHSFDIARGVGFSLVTGGLLRPVDWASLEAAEDELPWVAFYVALNRLAHGDRAGAMESLRKASELGDDGALLTAMELFRLSDDFMLTPGGSGLSNAPAPEDLRQPTSIRQE
jgi:hypothetical protein